MTPEEETLPKNDLSWSEFQRVELCVGTVVEVLDFPEARRPAWILRVDFGAKIGIKKSSAQITDHYGRADLIGRQVIGVINFPAKQIGPIRSECLITGFPDSQGAIVLAIPERAVPNGTRLA